MTQNKKRFFQIVGYLCVFTLLISTCFLLALEYNKTTNQLTTTQADLANKNAIISEWTSTDTSTIALVTIGAISKQTYTGEAITPDIILMVGNTILDVDVDYTVAYSDNIEIGTATATITAIGNYSGEFTTTYTIQGIDIAPFVSFFNTSVTYNGEAQYIGVSVIDNEGNELVEGVDYEVWYAVDNPIDAGSYFVEVHGIGHYRNNASQIFDIVQLDLSAVTITMGANEYEYTGEMITPTYTLTYADYTLVEGLDYYYGGYSDRPLNVGTYTIYFNGGFGNFTGETHTTFDIVCSNPTDISSLTVQTDSCVGISSTILGVSGYSIVCDFAILNNGSILQYGVDYTITFSHNIESPEAGTYTGVMTGINRYTGSIDIEYRIVLEA